MPFLLYPIPENKESCKPVMMKYKSAHLNKLYPRLEEVKPRTVHQIWIQGEEHLKINRPHFYSDFLEYRKIQNGRHQLWSEDMIESLIVHEYPHLLTLYHSYTHFIMRVDLAKYIILHYYGGFYVDMDSKCLLNFESLSKMAKPNQPLVCEVSDDYRTKLYSKKFINNHFLYLPYPKHPFMEIMLSQAPITAKRRPLEPMILYILRAVGPGFLMHCIKKYKQQCQKQYNAQDKHIFHKRINTEDIVTVIDSKILNAYFVHDSKNTWLEDQWMDEKDKHDYMQLLNLPVLFGGSLGFFFR